MKKSVFLPLIAIVAAAAVLLGIAGSGQLGNFLIELLFPVLDLVVLFYGDVGEFFRKVIFVKFNV